MNYFDIFNNIKHIYDQVKPLIFDKDSIADCYKKYSATSEVVKSVENYVDTKPVSSDNIVYNNIYYLLNSCNTYTMGDNCIIVDGKRYDKMFIPIKANE